jgi:hypothetical protein
VLRWALNADRLSYFLLCFCCKTFAKSAISSLMLLTLNFVCSDLTNACKASKKLDMKVQMTEMTVKLYQSLPVHKGPSIALPHVIPPQWRKNFQLSQRLLERFQSSSCLKVLTML